MPLLLLLVIFYVALVTSALAGTHLCYHLGILYYNTTSGEGLALLTLVPPITLEVEGSSLAACFHSHIWQLQLLPIVFLLSLWKIFARRNYVYLVITVAANIMIIAAAHFLGNNPRIGNGVLLVNAITATAPLVLLNLIREYSNGLFTLIVPRLWTSRT